MGNGDAIYTDSYSVSFEFDATGYGYGSELLSHSLDVSFERTVRVPEDGHDHWLPPTFGSFELTATDSGPLRLPQAIKKRRGVCFPIYEHEALWFDLSISGPFRLPVALKVAAGKVNAVSGKPWTEDPADEQDYLVAPHQPWLDGFNSGDDVIRQFVATELGKSESVESHLTGGEVWGGIQLLAIPMKPEYYRSIIEAALQEAESTRDLNQNADPDLDISAEMDMCCSMIPPTSMGLGAGGKIRQTIEQDPYGVDQWDFTRAQRLFVSMINADQWEGISGVRPHPSPITPAEYNGSGGPWYHFDGKDDIGPSPEFDDLPPLLGPEEEQALHIPAFLRRTPD